MGVFDSLLDASNNAVSILDEHKDKILLVGGLVAGAGTVVAASRATLKSQKVIDIHKRNVKNIKETCDLLPQWKDSDDHKRAVVATYANTGIQMAKMYAPAVVLGATSVACIIGEHCIMEKKVNNLEKTVASLSAAYIAIDNAFKAYRKRVVDKYGKEEDYKLRYGIKEEVVESKDEKGKKKKEKKEYLGDLPISDYAKFFDATSTEFKFQDPMKYKPDWDANITFLKLQESFANTRLEREGYLFLNDVYDMLGIPKTKAGQVVGWIYDPEDKSIDNRISFGIFEPRNHRTINGYEEECILLDFNVDGVIIDKVRNFGDF